MEIRRTLTRALMAATAMTLAGAAQAGPFILAGTDADDHGSATATENLDGWLFMQRALENLAAASSLTRTQNTIAVLGSDSGEARDAIESALGFSTLSGTWSLIFLEGDAAISGFFADTNAAGLNSTDASFLYIPADGVGGGIDSAEEVALAASATQIDLFVESGGALFSQEHNYAWLTALIPTLTTIPDSSTGLTLTPAGQAAFPGLTDADLSSGPYHNGFANTGAIPILAISVVTGNAIIIGGAGGSITDPDPIPTPAPGALALLGLGAIGLGFMRRRGR